MIRRWPLILLVIVLLASGCSPKGIIPPKKMARILHDMYLLDAQIENDVDYTIMADTTAVYGALFDEYGYTVEDFNRSLDHYLHDPIAFKEIFKMAHDRYEKEALAYEAEAEREMVVDEDPFMEEQPAEQKVRRRGRNRIAPPPDDMIEYN
jgi:hypothetical protein